MKPKLESAPTTAFVTVVQSLPEPPTSFWRPTGSPAWTGGVSAPVNVNGRPVVPSSVGTASERSAATRSCTTRLLTPPGPTTYQLRFVVVTPSARTNS